MEPKEKQGKKQIAQRVFFRLSVLLLAASFVSFVRFLAVTAQSAPSFAEAVKHFLRFYASAYVSLLWLVFAIVCAWGAVRLAYEASRKRKARRLFATELVLFAFSVLLIVTMHVVV